MRRRAQKGDFSVRGIAGSHTVLLGMNVLRKSAHRGLLGFSLKRTDHTEDESYWLKGFRTFEQNASSHPPGTLVSTWLNPIQDFVWADYTAKPGHRYTYIVVPRHGTPDDLLTHPPVRLTISTECEDEGTHAVFFNRAAAASQAYCRRFGNVSPLEVGPPALKWLSRGLVEALIGFIRQAEGEGWGIRASVYEFTHVPVLTEFKAAIDRGVDVRIVFDNKKRGPGEANRAAMRKAGIEPRFVAERNSNPSYISHNKFMLLLKDGEPLQVWTGSTNITPGGLFGHSNVGHVIRDKRVAEAYLNYWHDLVGDPVAKELRLRNDRNTPIPGMGDPKRFIKPIFSPRGSLEALQWYAERMDAAKTGVFLTAAFGINELFRGVLEEDKPYLRYVLLDKPGKGLDIIKRDSDNRISVGGVLNGNALEDWLNHKWKAERLSGLNVHVKYIHTKYMLIDPLGDDPMVITGSANFSVNSTKNNDENMIVVRGNKRVADMYLCEFMRLFDHFRFRGTRFGAKGRRTRGKVPSLYLSPDDSWTNHYFQEGHPKCKQRLLFS